jgi:hypothetical protein
VIWGVIVTILGLGVMALATRRDLVDLEVVVILALFAAGAILLLCAVVAAVRGRAKTRLATAHPPIPPS